MESLAADYRVLGIDLKKPTQDFPWLRCDLTKDDSVSDTLRAIRQQHGPRIATVVGLLLVIFAIVSPASLPARGSRPRGVGECSAPTRPVQVLSAVSRTAR
jgi:hypothetical protein